MALRPTASRPPCHLRWPSSRCSERDQTHPLALARLTPPTAPTAMGPDPARRRPLRAPLARRFPRGPNALNADRRCSVFAWQAEQGIPPTPRAGRHATPTQQSVQPRHLTSPPDGQSGNETIGKEKHSIPVSRYTASSRRSRHFSTAPVTLAPIGGMLHTPHWTSPDLDLHLSLPIEPNVAVCAVGLCWLCAHHHHDYRTTKPLRT